MKFFAVKDGERFYSLEMPVDDGPVHLPDLVKLGVAHFQSQHPDVSIREDEILFGFEKA